MAFEVGTYDPMSDFWYLLTYVILRAQESKAIDTIFSTSATLNKDPKSAIVLKYNRRWQKILARYF